ncbi:MAG TPA: lysophospholipid acyltransferase family protein [Pyrinomonadaceae bacterium]|nr:lysophospholipid acyltransferase family protein [Pyrinomonadaceae bacterium]
MSGHSENPSSELVDERDANAKVAAREVESNTRPSISRRLFYRWALLTAALLLIVLGAPAILLSWLSRRNLVYPVAVRGGRIWLRLIGVKVHLKGSENLAPDKTYVLISNHRSYLDPPALLTSIRKRLGFIAKKELLRVPVLGQGMRYVNAVAIDRGRSASAIQRMKLATERLHSGVSFVVFAEGTRARAAELLPFKKGGFYMAVQAGAQIAPVVIKNTDRLMGKGTGEARPGTIEITILPPVETEGLSTDEDVGGLIEKVHSMIKSELDVKSVPPGL